MVTSTVTIKKTQPKVIAKKVETKRKQVGILGGTFNPIHIAHLILAEQVYSKLSLDRVLFIPDNIPPHKQKKGYIDAKDRCRMVHLAIKDNPHFLLNLTEIERGGISYTVDTIKYLKDKHPDTDYTIIIGEDMVNDLPNWHNIDELSHLVTFAGVKRPGYTPKTDSPYPIIWVDAPNMSISSTAIRQLCHNHESIKYLVPDAINKYILQEGLYLD